MSNDAYVRTTAAKHKAAAQALWREALTLALALTLTLRELGTGSRP